MSPLLALGGHGLVHCTCPLRGTYDPKRTSPLPRKGAGRVQLPTRLSVVTCYDPTFAAWSSRGRMQWRDFSKVVVAPQPLGRSRRARSRPIRCGESAPLQQRRDLDARGSIREYVFANIDNNGGDQGGQNEILTLNASYRS